MNSFVHGPIGTLHLAFAVGALVLATGVLWMPKGTPRHRIWGRANGISMLGVNSTAFALYHLFGTWGIFHWTALISLGTLFLGMIPMWRRRPVGYLRLHLSFMYWSAMGLYAAAVSETLVRFPELAQWMGITRGWFYALVGMGTAAVMGIGAVFFVRKLPDWDR